MTQIVITGMGVVSSIGHQVDDFRAGLSEGKCGIDFLDEMDSASIGAMIRNFDFHALFDKYQSCLPEDMIQRVQLAVRRTSLAMQTVILSSIEAWYGAQLHESQIDPHRRGLIVAGSNLTQQISYSLYDLFQREPEYISPSYALRFMDTNYVGVLSEIFQIYGEGFSLGAASASGNAAIIKGCQLVKSGEVDACLIVAPVADLSPMEMRAFFNIGALGGRTFQSTPNLACRPFDSEHEGFIYGQASAALIVESLESALSRNAPILGYILGGAFHLDGNRLSNPSVEGEAQVMEQAIKRAGVSLDDIGYINTHGTSSPLGDVTELLAIRTTFGDRVSDIWLNATKSLTGHCLFSSGVVEAIASVIQMNEDFVHPTLNLSSPIESGFRFCVGASASARLDTVMSNSFGFGGINTSIIFGKRRGQ
ncbi:beta-ketoacyl synthase N-terminal-like domain-containing protein [Paenibacillaceae sp. P-4]|uniref:beta-ketoacyl synthase N-terminal-like domain-containing protein n=1 Tax=Paenibacillaceae bacterium P-4 TaxID=3160969 RepID=UPI0032E82CA3